jgi:hypothetical protein
VQPDKNRWEHGSEFHWLGPAGPVGPPPTHPWAGRGTLFGSGRDALRALIRFGGGALGWERVFVPSFLCQEVVGALVSEGLGVEAYYDDPREPIDAPCPGPGDALLIVNTFGVRARWRRPNGCAGAVIEDHTHDPWSTWARTSDADYCLASLRKTLPMPDGGVIWSPAGLQLPDAPGLTPAHAAASARKLEAMLLKAFFLHGHAVEKDVFRTLAVAGEAAISTEEVSAMSPVSVAIINCLDMAWWRKRRFDNLALLVDRLGKRSEITVLRPKEQGACPFSAVLVCADPSIRDRLRRGLIERRVYPAVLWPLEERALDLPERSVELSRRVLSLHCDGRYGEADMVRVASAVVESLS